MSDETRPGTTEYDSRGRWIRTDRPEMLSDRLGYPAEVGDEDWARIKARRAALTEMELVDAAALLRDAGWAVSPPGSADG